MIGAANFPMIVLLGLSEIEGSIGYGDLPEEQLAQYKMSEMLLRNLLYKINV